MRMGFAGWERSICKSHILFMAEASGSRVDWEGVDVAVPQASSFSLIVPLV